MSSVGRFLVEISPRPIVLDRIAAFPLIGLLALATPLAAQEKPSTQRLTLPTANVELGDFDAMRKRRLVRVLVPFNQTSFFIDRGTPRGLVHDAFKMFEARINKKYKTGHLQIHVAFIPIRRSDVASALLDGKGDVAAASITVTPEWQEKFDFSTPNFRNVSEIVVAGPASEAIASVDDLSGREVFVQRDSIYYESLERLNADLIRRGRPPVTLRLAPDALEDEDLLEMVNAGLVQYIVVADTLARFWAAVLPGLRLYPEAKLRSGMDIAWAMRKNSPLLKAELDAFLAAYPARSATRNVLFQTYLKSTKFVTNAASKEEMAKFHRMEKLFEKYSDRYDMDPLLMAAQGYQESRLNQQARSRAGAVGVMQLTASTGKSMKVGDVTKLEPNIHAGVKYMRLLVDRYFSLEPMDRLNRGLFAFAAYNGGPTRNPASPKRGGTKWGSIRTRGSTTWRSWRP